MLAVGSLLSFYWGLLCLLNRLLISDLTSLDNLLSRVNYICRFVVN